MANDHIPPEQEHRASDEHRASAESARNEAEEFRRLAEEAREVRDRHREALEDQIAIMMGGRAAKHLILDTISTGAVDDIQRATQLATRMVTDCGMSEKLGSVRYAGQRLQYIGGAVNQDSHSSAETRETIDAEVRRIVGEQFARAEALPRRSRLAGETGSSRRTLMFGVPHEKALSERAKTPTTLPPRSRGRRAENASAASERHAPCPTFLRCAT
jgi:peptidase M41-like protein